jgi:hypothetical protein
MKLSKDCNEPDRADFAVATFPRLTAKSHSVWCLCCVVALLLTTPAWSNGDLFFNLYEIPGKPEYVVFGNVKDDRGNHLENASVTVVVDDPRLSYTSDTDILGHFRSLDIGRAIRGLGYPVDPTLIKVTVKRPGFVEVQHFYRGKYGQSKGAVEWNFVMTRAPR